MNVDYLTLACLRDRLDGLLGARVQRVVQPDALAIGLELYARERFQLLVSAHPQHLRMLLTPHKLRRGAEAETPLLLLLRKWIGGARLVDVTQPPWERILELHFDGQAGPCRLVVELIGRYSNIILVEPDGGVLDAMKRVGPDLNRYRVILPHHPYRPPPQPVGRRPPTATTPNEWAALLAAADPEAPLHRLLTQQFLGVSPLVAREIAARAAGDAEATVHATTSETLATTAAELFAPLTDGSWAPHVALDEEGNVIAFAPYQPRQFERIRPARDINEAMWEYFAGQLTADAYAAARRRVQRWLDEARARIERVLEQLRDNLTEEQEIEALREAGELLLAYQGQVKRDARQVTVPDYSGAPRTIELDPTLTPVENAQVYFRRYRKAVRAAVDIPTRLAEMETDRAYLEQLTADLALAESRPEIDAVRDALAEAGWGHRASRASARVEGPRRFEIAGFIVYVGRNARQNDEITFKRAAPDDLWLHARGLPGAHVILKRGGREVPEEALRQAAGLAAYYSPAPRSGLVEVDVTERRFVHRVGRRRPGLVTYRNEQTIQATPELPS